MQCSSDSWSSVCGLCFFLEAYYLFSFPLVSQWFMVIGFTAGLFSTIMLNIQRAFFDLQMHAFEFEKIFVTNFFFLISFLLFLSSSYISFFRTLSLFHGWNFFSFLSEEIRIFFCLFVLLWFLSLLISWSQFLRRLSFSVLVCIFHIHSFPQISEKPCFCSATCLNGKLKVELEASVFELPKLH